MLIQRPSEPKKRGANSAPPRVCLIGLARNTLPGLSLGNPAACIRILGGERMRRQSSALILRYSRSGAREGNGVASPSDTVRSFCRGMESAMRIACRLLVFMKLKP